MKISDLFNQRAFSSKDEYLDFLDTIVTEEQVLEIARIKPANTGLPFMIRASASKDVHERHGPRIKVSNRRGEFDNLDNFTVSIDNNPTVKAGKPKFTDSEVQDIKDWVLLNKEPLLKYWRDEYESDGDFYLELKKL